MVYIGNPGKHFKSEILLHYQKKPKKGEQLSLKFKSTPRNPVKRISCA